MRNAALIVALIISSTATPSLAQETLTAPKLESRFLRGGVAAFGLDAASSNLQLTQRKAGGAFLTPRVSVARGLPQGAYQALRPQVDLASPFDLAAIREDVHRRLLNAQAEWAPVGVRAADADGLHENVIATQQGVHQRLLDLEGTLIGDPDKLAEDPVAQNVHARLLDTQAELAATDLKGVLLPPPPPVVPLKPRLERKLRPANSSVLSWDDWYKQLTELLRQPLLAAMEKFGNPVGANTIRVSVKSNHKLVVVVEKSGGPEFDAAIVEAYSAIDGHELLEFPNGSLRPRVTFLTDHRHASDAPVDDVTALTLKGDKENIFTIK